jgi:hypothetical protein
MARVSDAWLGSPLSPSPTGNHHIRTTFSYNKNGTDGGLSPDYVPAYSRESGKHIRTFLQLSSE